MKKIITTLLLLLFVTQLAYAQRVITPDYVSTPRDLQMWLRGNFIYIGEEPGKDHWQSVVETLDKRGGDCEDFVILVQKVFHELMVDSWFIAIYWENKGHAIAVFKESDGTYSYFDNQYYREVRYKTINELLLNEYPNAHSFINHGYKGHHGIWLY